MNDRRPEQPIHLRNATLSQIEDAVVDAHSEFLRNMRRANAIEAFKHAALRAGVDDFLHADHAGMLELAISEGLFRFDGTATPDMRNLVSKTVAFTIDGAEMAMKTAVAVVLHAAIEQFLLRFIRLGAINRRHTVLGWIGNQKISISQLSATAAADLQDQAIESWLVSLERKSVIEKWDIYASLLDVPSNLVAPPEWHFDRQLLVLFDAARHDAVHSTGAALTKFDLDNFRMQWSRVSWAIMFAGCKTFGVKVDPHRWMHGQSIS